MKLEFIATLANETVRLRFTAMERSLRATGCRLPLRVIPYDERRFPLPVGAEWWEAGSFFEFLRVHGSHPTMRKFICLTTGGYQFVDSDVIFLRDPQAVLHEMTGWITSCGTWRDPAHVLTPELRARLAKRSPLAQRWLFNSGQFACDRPLYDEESLKGAMLDPEDRATALTFPYHEQPGLNLLVIRSGVPITNLTLPPTEMESTWAGDYPGEFRPFWAEEKRMPYLIHWAGSGGLGRRPIDELFLQHLSVDERTEWQRQEAEKRRMEKSPGARLGMLKHRVGRAMREAASLLRTGRTLEERSRGW